MSGLFHLHRYVWKTFLKSILRMLCIDMSLELSLHLYWCKRSAAQSTSGTHLWFCSFFYARSATATFTLSVFLGLIFLSTHVRLESITSAHVDLLSSFIVNRVRVTMETRNCLWTKIRVSSNSYCGLTALIPAIRYIDTSRLLVLRHVVHSTQYT